MAAFKMARDRSLGDKAEVDLPRINITPEMEEAGLRVAWSSPDAPDFVRRQVSEIYTAMELKRRDVEQVARGGGHKKGRPRRNARA